MVRSIIPALALLLGACAQMEGGGYYAPPPYAQPYGQPYAPAPAYSEGNSLSDLQEKALHDGCMLRYNQVPHKLHECLNQEGNWRDALAQGCEARYNQVPHKLRECMEY